MSIIKTYNVVDKEYNERIKAAKGTNLIAEKPYECYVPLKLVQNLYLSYLNSIDDGSDPHGLDDIVPDDIIAIRDQIDSSVIKLNFVSDEDTKSINICPYCGTEMRIQSESPSKHHYLPIATFNKLYFECPVCESRSPWTFFDHSMLDNNKVTKAIENNLEDTIVKLHEYNEEENDNGREEDE